MARRRYLVSYDIADDKRRNSVFKTRNAWGDHAQFSVFFTELNPRELATLKTKLDSAIHHDEDQVLILDLGPHTESLEGALECLGKVYRPPSRVVVV